MYAYLIAATGWTWEYIGEWMTLPRVYALFDHWKQWPPMHITAALFAGTVNSTQRADSRPRASVTPIDNASITKDMHTDPRKLTWRGVRNG
jgi:hypothetical protein